jgi:hypothetical protein
MVSIAFFQSNVTLLPNYIAVEMDFTDVIAGMNGIFFREIIIHSKWNESWKQSLLSLPKNLS